MSPGPFAELVLRSATPEETERVAAAFVPFLQSGDVVLLTGDLGAGKTVFAQGLARAAGVTQAVTSPTFTLLHSYPTAIGLDLLHADVYRLETTGEIEDLGLAELVEDDAFALVEWGERAAGALGPDHVFVTLTAPAVSDGPGPSLRRIAVRPAGRSWDERWADLRAALLGAAPALRSREVPA
ncbi:MAG: tRNA (adenosine(37)-N6)-threonylcarbamoyltransferase complex ATPase subunit type 1 TsaE [Acidimicrobiaceae bacterium]|nr:tRNA (adenosine(37)-N6)-threonylcarbamoyltransferase complex ATPase subunit type 1 TsaE [Acidimicrobiaceae bacterium]